MNGSENIKHSVTIDGHRTSVTLERAFWDSLKEIAAARTVPLSTLIAEADKRQPRNLSGALRVFVLEFYKEK
jgi:predicted DNA-binding ribbon-helix-helix protein